MSLRGWEKLTCNEKVDSSLGFKTQVCGSEDFIAVHRLTWHEGQGTANKQDAWKCAKCGAVASTGKMIEAIQK